MIAAPTAALLAGCGAGADEDVPEAPTRRVTSVQGDIELLTAARRHEVREVGLYRGAAPKGHAATWRRFHQVEAEHADRIAKALRDLGAPSRDTFTFSPGRRPELEEAVEAEDDAIAFWIDTIPKLYDPALRSLAAGILTAEAEQLAVLRAELDLDPAPDAFVYGWTRQDEG